MDMYHCLFSQEREQALITNKTTHTWKWGHLGCQSWLCHSSCRHLLQLQPCQDDGTEEWKSIPHHFGERQDRRSWGTQGSCWCPGRWFIIQSRIFRSGNCVWSQQEKVARKKGGREGGSDGTWSLPAPSSHMLHLNLMGERGIHTKYLQN